MSVELLRQKDDELKIEYNRLCLAEETLRPKLDGEFISEIKSFLENLAKDVEFNVISMRNFQWASSSYRIWYHYLLDRGIPLESLLSIIPSPSKLAYAEAPKEVQEVSKSSLEPFTEVPLTIAWGWGEKTLNSKMSKSFG